MPNKRILIPDDMSLFKTAVNKVKKLKQDTVVRPMITPIRKKMNQQKRQNDEHQCALYLFDEHHILLQNDPIRYSSPNAPPYELKKLRRGAYVPELFLDLHGFTKREAKQEIAALITACLYEQIHCACIMYGHGKNILKKQTPIWLAQHPNIICFHQAPPKYGGSAALLFLIDIEF